MALNGATQQVNEEYYQYFSKKGYTREEITTFMRLIYALKAKNAVLAKEISSEIKGEQIAKVKQFRSEYSSYEEEKVKKDLENKKAAYVEAEKKRADAEKRHAEAHQKMELATSLCDKLDQLSTKFQELDLKEKELLRQQEEARRQKEASLQLHAKNLSKDVKEFKDSSASGTPTASSSMRQKINA